MKTIFLVPSLLIGFASAALARADVDFTTQVLPIFQKSCIGCHGAEKKKGGLRLDSKAAALKGGDDGIVLVPGDPGKSDLYRRINLPAGNDDVMPSKGDLLTKAQTDLIRDWIKQGAPWPETAVAAAATEAPFVPKPIKIEPPDPELPANFKPAPAEAKSVAALQAMGVDLWPIAAGSPWHEASLRGQSDHNADAALAQLKNVTSLVNLNLAGTAFTSASLAGLKTLENLRQLHLEHTKVKDADLEVVTGMPTLSYLNLYDTSVTDAGMDHLKSLTNLHHVHLWQTKVTTNGAAALQKSLPHCDIDLGWVAPPTPPPAATETNKPMEKK